MRLQNLLLVLLRMSFCYDPFLELQSKNMINKQRRALSLGIVSLPVILLLPDFLHNTKITSTSNSIVNKGGWLLLDSDT